jgi:acyl-CoA thioester hydrolase
MSEPPEIWRGGVNTWECDEMGHMSVRFYIQRFMEGAASLARLLGMETAFAAHATSTLLVRTHHLRFQREAHAGAPLHMTGAVAEMGETRAVFLQVLRHSLTGEPAATALLEAEHVEPKSLRPFAWPARVAAAAEALTQAAPSFAAPRGLSGAPATPTASGARADALGLPCLGRGTVRPAELDVFGRMRPDAVIGRISDGVPSLIADVRRAVKASAGEEVRRLGGAVLEYRVLYLAPQEAGDHVELRSGFSGFGEKTQRLVHWLIDPVTGAATASAEALAVNLDLDARSVVPIAPEARALLDHLVVPGLAL